MTPMFQGRFYDLIKRGYGRGTGNPDPASQQVIRSYLSQTLHIIATISSQSPGNIIIVK